MGFSNATLQSSLHLSSIKFYKVLLLNSFNLTMQRNNLKFLRVIYPQFFGGKGQLSYLKKSLYFFFTINGLNVEKMV